MPELPEVETTIRDLKHKIIGLKIKDVWCDSLKTLRLEGEKYKGISQRGVIDKFKRELKNKTIQGIWRVGKNIIIDLSNNLSLLIHQKLTGHLLFGKWRERQGQWIAQEPGPLERDPMNRFLHVLFFLSNGYQLALSDLRKFAKVELWDKKELKNSSYLKNLGPDALSPSLTFEEFKERIKNKEGKIKQVLMDQNVIAGIGNIYSDEILFAAKINPLRKTSTLKDEELEAIYKKMREILKKAIELKGTSVSDYRVPDGKRGEFEKMLKVYRKEGESCAVCGKKIKRVKIGGRSAHFCPNCQK